MNKFFTTLILVLSTLSLLHAQDGYVKFKKDTELSGKKFFKGEIYAISKETKDAKPYYFIVGSETFNVGQSVEKMQTPPEDKAALKDNFIKSKSGGLVHIDVSTVNSGNDTIWFVSEKNERTPLFNERTIDKDQTKIGKAYRLIIPNAPTIYYSFDSLTKIEEPKKVEESDSDNDGILDSKDNCPDEYGVAENHGCPKKGFFASLAWWYYLLFILLLGGIGFAIWKFFFKKEPVINKSPKTVKYSGGSLNDFARENDISLYDLIKLNKDTIPKNFNSMSDQQKKDWKKKNKKGVYLKIGYSELSEQEVLGNSDFGQLRRDETSQKENVFVAEQRETTNQFNTNSDYATAQQIRNLETKLTLEIRNVGSRGNDNSNEVNKLNREISDLKNDKNKLESEKRNLDSTINQLRSEKDNSERSIDSIREEKNQKNSELNKLQDKVITVDFLTAYSDGVLAYLKLCNEVSSDAFDYFNRISQQNLHDAFAAGHLLMTFQNSVNAIPVGNWMQIAQDIKDTGATTNKKLIRSFSQIQNEEERKREFQRLLFSEVLVKYSSSILILAEAFRNLGRFQASSELVNDAQNTFSKHVLELVSKVKATGLENKYVALFKNFEDFLGQAELVDREKSFAYKGITGLEKGAIVEIVSYGVKTNFEETKTLIILA
jgi:hypothetical protein